MSMTTAVRPRGRGVAIGVGALAVLLAALDAYVVVTLLVTMARDMEIAVNKLELATPIVTGFLFGYLAGMPLLGGLSDRLGRRAVIQLCLGGFLIGSVITAASTQIADRLGDVAPLPILVAGRALQGLAGGALLPVTMALVADLWEERRRPLMLGVVGAAQELGSVLGPVYGATLAALIGWRGIFWVNVPLALIAMIAVHYAMPPRVPGTERPKVDVTGGLLLAVSLGLLVIGLYNQEPDKSVLAPWGPTTTAVGGAVFLLFLLWEWRARTRLVDLSGSRKLPFFAVLGASFIAGAALLVTLVDVSLVAQTILGRSDQAQSAMLLARFLIALPVGAIVGGLLAPRLGMRSVSVGGFLIAGFAYWLISRWPMNVLETRHVVAGVSLPQFDTDLAIAGLGLGLVIAPLSAAVLRIVPAVQAGVASAGVVVSRTMGMLIGFAALTAWGLHRFHELTADLVPPLPPFGSAATASAVEKYNQESAIYNAKLNAALLTEYHEIFFATGVLCVVAAATSLAIARRERAPA
jgi:MFS family permease